MSQESTKNSSSPWNTRVTLSDTPSDKLRRLAAEIGQRQHQAGGDDAERIEAAEEGDDDRREAIARRNRRLQMADRARDFGDAGKPRERAREQEAENQIILREEKPAKRPARSGLAEHDDLEALQRIAAS